MVPGNMPSPYADILRRHCRPLEPIPTGETPVLGRLEGIRAVLFDVYGTLFISASGDVGTAKAEAAGSNAATLAAGCVPAGRAAGLVPAPQWALAGALKAMGIPAADSVGEGVIYLFRVIEASHAESRKAGIDHPEVDLVEIWRKVLDALARQGLVERAVCAAVDLKRLAVEYEARANPCWPMPGLPECLVGVRQGGLLLGIVSNAQFYTPELFEALLGKPAEGWGFDPQLQYYSYRHGRAKPGLALYRLAAEALQRRGVAASAALYVGNDMLNDILPAGELGFRTALFAGDARSLRRREAEGQSAEISPDLVCTDLGQVIGCIIG